MVSGPRSSPEATLSTPTCTPARNSSRSARLMLGGMSSPISRFLSVDPSYGDSLLRAPGRHAAGPGDQGSPRVAFRAAVPVEHRPQPSARGGGAGHETVAVQVPPDVDGGEH